MSSTPPSIDRVETAVDIDGAAMRATSQPGLNDPADRGRADAKQVGTLRLIAVFKLLKAIVLILAGLGALGMLRAEWTDAVVDLLHQLSLEHGRRLASAFAERGETLLSSATPRRLTEVAIGCFVYGGVFLVEAVGLWTKRRWAEYLTTIMTASLLPFEIAALLNRVTFERGLALLLNLAIVAYLVFHLWKSHRASGPRASRPAGRETTARHR